MVLSKFSSPSSLHTLLCSGVVFFSPGRCTPPSLRPAQPLFPSLSLFLSASLTDLCHHFREDSQSFSARKIKIHPFQERVNQAINDRVVFVGLEIVPVGFARFCCRNKQPSHLSSWLTSCSCNTLAVGWLRLCFSCLLSYET